MPTAYAEDTMSLHPNAQHRSTAWIRCEDDLPAPFDGGILVYFSESDAIETVNCEDYFAPITAGLDENGGQKWTKWYLSQKVTHWALLIAPPTF